MNCFDVSIFLYFGDFDVSFARGLSLEDGAATLTDFTASIIGEVVMETILKNKLKIRELLICGGGRKNLILLEMEN